MQKYKNVKIQKIQKIQKYKTVCGEKKKIICKKELGPKAPSRGGRRPPAFRRN